MKYCMICAGLLLELKGGPTVFEFTTFNPALKYAGISFIYFLTFLDISKTAPFNSSDFKKGQYVLVFSHHHGII